MHSGERRRGDWNPNSDGRSASAKPASRTRLARAVCCGRDARDHRQAYISARRPPSVAKQTHKPASQSIPADPASGPLALGHPNGACMKPENEILDPYGEPTEQSGSRTRRSTAGKGRNGGASPGHGDGARARTRPGVYFCQISEIGSRRPTRLGDPQFRRRDADRHCDIGGIDPQQPDPSRFQRKRRHGTKRRSTPGSTATSPSGSSTSATT